MEEIELGGNEVELGENAFEAPTLFTDTNQKKVLVADELAAAVSGGGDLAQTLEETATQSAEELKLKAAGNYVQQQTQLVDSAVKMVAMEQPEQLPAAIKGAQTFLSNLDEKRQSKILPYLAWVDKMQGSEKLSQSEKESIAIDTAFLQAISEGLDKRAWYEDAHDILGLMAVPDESYNVADVEQQLVQDTAGFKDWLESGDAMANIAQFRSSLSSSERLMFDERLIEILQNVDDNRLQQVMLAMNIMGRDSESEVFQAIEKFDALTLGAGLAHGLFNGLRTLNVLNRTAKAGDARTAAIIAEQVSRSPEMAKEAGVAQVDAALLGNPVSPSGLFKGAPDGLQKKYRDYSENVEEALDRARSSLGYTISLETKDADEIVAAMNKSFSKRDDIENIKVFRSKAGVMFEYDVVDAAGNITKERETRLYTLDELGGFKDKESGFIASSLRPLTSPNTLLKQDREVFVQAAEALLYAKGRVSKGLSEAVDAALAPVANNKKSLANVSDMLVHLDGRKITPDYQTLVLEGVGGKSLTNDEFVAFTGVRKVLDDTYWLNNDILHREMTLRGVKEVADGDGTSVFSKTAGDAETAYTMFSGDVENTLIRNGDEVLAGIGLDEFKQFYREGKVLVKADSSNVQEWFESGSGKVRFALVDKGDVSDLPNVVLSKQPNYLPKLREDANFFVKKTEDIVVNGKVRQIQKTLAYAPTETQAKAYIAKLERAAIEAGGEFDASKYSTLFDREISKGLINSDTITMNGGLIRGKRKSSELEFAGSFQEGGRTDALDAIQRYMGITADRYSLAEWRLEARTRLVNEAASHPEIGEKAKSVGWTALRAEIEASNIDLQKRAKLLAAYDQVSEMSNIPSATDQRFRGYVKSVGLKLDRAGMLGSAKYLYQMHDKSLVDVLKGLTFNLTLGMFNWVQIPTQIMGASVAVSIAPKSALLGAPRWLIASGLDFITNEKSAKAFLSKMSKATGVDEKSVYNDYTFWRKSGMFESVVRGSADAASITNRLPYDAGLLRRGFHAAIDKGQTPYRMGELGNMRISFFTALEEEKALKGKTFRYDDVALQRVIARAEQFRLNMSGANKASFQKGIWALPTQFKQIYGKYIEALGGSHFTGKEKVSLLIGQALLFGAAGVPIVNHFTDQMLSLTGLEGKDVTAEELTAIKRGAVGWMINEQMDIDALVAGRLTVSSDVIEDFRRALLDTNTPALKTMLGASFTSGDKIFDLFSNLIFAGNMVIDEYTEGDKPHVALKAAAEILARSVANVPSSSRKWLAAWDLTEGMVRKSDGSLLMEVDGSMGDVYMRAIGFASQDVEDLYKLRQTEADRKERIKVLSNRYISLLYDLQNAVTNQDEASVEAHQIAAALVKRQIYAWGEVEGQEIMDTVINRIGSSRDFKEETIRTAILNMQHGLTGSANELSIIVKKYIEDNNLGN